MPQRRTPADRPAAAPLSPANDAAAVDAEDGRAPVRRPRQERGERRVAAILDAASELIADVGLEGLTVQRLAERAQTSKSSLYHFFPDVQAVLGAVLDRHNAQIAAVVSGVGAAPAVAWEQLTVDETVERMVAPLLDYLESRPDLLALVREIGRAHV